MCLMIEYKDKEINTPQELIDILGIPKEQIAIAENYKLELNKCLCQIDIKKTLRDAGINFRISEDTFDYEIID